MKLNKTDAIRIMTDACKKFALYLDDKEFLIIYNENGTVKYSEVGFRKSHFLHLTGVTTTLSARRFYEKCMTGKLAVTDFQIDNADYFVGDTRFVLSIGFRYGKRIDNPVTLYSGDVRKYTKPTNRVLAIFVHTYPAIEYRETTYIAKDIELKELNLPQKVSLPS